MKKMFTLLVAIFFSVAAIAQFNCTNSTELWCNETISGNNITNCYNTVSQGYCGTANSLYNGKEKIYSFQVTGNSKTIKLLLSNLTADLDMFLLRSCSPSDCVAKSTNSSSYNYEFISTTLTPGTYYVVLDGWSGASSNFHLTLECVEDSGELECIDAQSISCGQSISSNTNTGFNNTDGLYCNAHGSYSGKEKVYELNLTSTEEVTIIASGLAADLDMFLLNACDRRTCIAISGRGGSNSEVIKKTLPAGDYFIVLDGYQGVQSPFTLSVSCGTYQAVDCDDLVTSYYSGNGSNLKFNYKFNAQANLQFVAWKVNGTTLATAPSVQFVFPNAGNYNVCAVYKNTTTGQTLTCCRTACISAPITCQDIISYQYVNGVYKLTMNTNMANVSNLSWRNDTDGINIDPNNMPASCRTLTISVRYYDTYSNCWVVCCRTISFCPPSACQDGISSSYNPQTNKYTFTFNHPTATDLRWKFDETGEYLPNGEYVLPAGWDCKNRTATVYYYDTALNAWKACCKKFNLCPPETCDGTIDYEFLTSANEFKFTLNVQGATSVEWSFVEDGTSLPNGIFFLPANWVCKDRTVKASYYDPAYQTWRVCTKRFTICPPNNCASSIVTDYDAATKTFTYTLDIAGASDLHWRFDEGNIVLPGGQFTLPLGWQCRQYTVSVYWFDTTSDCWRVCCRILDVCPPMDCNDNQPVSAFSFEVNGGIVEFSNTSANSDSISWDYDGGVQNADGSISYAPGTYTACLTVFNECGYDELCKQFIIEEDVVGDELVFKIDSIFCRGEGTEVIIPVTTRNFDDILTFNFTIQASNSTDIKIQGIEDINPILTGGNNSVVMSDQVRFFWSSTEGQDLEDNALLFRIRILLINTTDAPVSLDFVDEPVNTEAFNGDLEKVNLLTENGSVCVIPLPDFANIGGRIMTPQGLSPVGKVTVAAIGNDAKEMTTSADGSFMLEELTYGDDYILRPSKNTDPHNGLNALDIVTLQRHILQISTLDSPYKMIAADVNNDKVVNAIDVVIMQRMQLRILDEFPNNDSWKFIPRNYVFTTNNPLTENYPEEITFEAINGDFMSEDFYGIKIGDLNNSIDPNRSSGPGDTLELTMDQIYASEDAIIKLDVRGNGFTELAVFEGTIEWDAEGLEFIEVNNFGVDNLMEENFGRPNGTDNQLTFSWTEATVAGKTVPDSTVLFTLVYKVVGMPGTEVEVDFADSPLDVSAADKDLEAVAVVENNGLVAILAPLSASANVQNVTCKFGSDGFIALDITGATDNYDYQWNTGATTDSIGGLEEGTYAFTVTDIFSGLVLEDSIRLVSPEQLAVDIQDVGADTDTLGTVTISVSGGVPPYAYAWSDGADSSTLIGVENGTYEVTVTDFNNCEIRGSITVDRTVSFIPEVAVLGWSVFPNPTLGEVTVSLEVELVDEISTWTVYNVLGERVLTGKVAGNQDKFTINLDASPGLYYLRIGDQSAPILVIK